MNKIKDSVLVGCKENGNSCPKQYDCLRISIDNLSTTLYKNACNSNNGYVLFVKKNYEENNEEDIKNNLNEGGGDDESGNTEQENS